jgi:hypothetical protein
MNGACEAGDRKLSPRMSFVKINGRLSNNLADEISTSLRQQAVECSPWRGIAEPGVPAIPRQVSLRKQAADECHTRISFTT